VSPQFDQLLCERYPLIFALRQAPVDSTCMGRGFSCEDGWFALIDALCARLQEMTDHEGAPQVVAAQVKEKFGTLRFYAEHANEAQRSLIHDAETRSARLCEICGEPGKTYLAGYCHMTRCVDHLPPEAQTLA